MPNWCQNVLYVNHTDKEKMAALLAAVKAGAMCDHILPMPEQLKGIVSGSCNIDGQQVRLWRVIDGVETIIPADEIEQLEAEYGTASWYEWALRNWHTKWDICDPWDTDQIYHDEGSGDFHVFKFDTAWSPPIGVYEEMVKQGFDVRAEYIEYGMGFCGDYINGDEYHYDEIPKDRDIDEHLESEYA